MPTDNSLTDLKYKVILRTRAAWEMTTFTQDPDNPDSLVFGFNIMYNHAINDIFFEAGIVQRVGTDGGQDLQFGVINPAAVNYNPNAVYNDPSIEPEFDFTSDDFGDFPYFLLGWSKDTDTGFISKAKLYPFSE